MKFTDGFWVVKPEFTANYVQDIYTAKEENDTLYLYAPYKRIQNRGNTLNVGLMTIAASTPMEDVLRIKLTAHGGKYKKEPEFEVVEFPTKPVIKMTDSGASIASGALKLSVDFGSPVLNFTAKEKPLTSSKYKDLAQMTRKDGTRFLVSSLSLDVGETVYGFGERFTSLVKNGQSIVTWNEDGGTASEISYKSIPFYYTNQGYGVFVNHPGKVSFEVASEKVESVQFSIQDETIEYFIIYGPTPKDILSKYTALTGRVPLLPKWSYGLWLTTSFTTNYDEATVNSFVDGMEKRGLPLSVFHFDTFWMEAFEWCSFIWDRNMFPDPKGMIERLHAKGLKICLWINPYIAEKSPLFKEAMDLGYLLKNLEGDVWQWDMWQAGMGLIDFTNPDAANWFQSKLKVLLDMGVDCFKTDFGERIPVDVQYHNGADTQKMHNYYTYLYNECVFELLKREKGEGQAILFARSATVGGQQFPVHWGGDSTSQFVSMAESLRGGLSLMDSGFGLWSHDIGGFEDDGSASVYKRWVQFGMLSSHSRLHGSDSYRVPWNYDEEACDVLRFFTKLKYRLMPYLYSKSVEAHLNGIPVMRPMHLEFHDDPACEYLDRQYMLGDSLLVAPVFNESGEASFYLPKGRWTELLTGNVFEGEKWYRRQYGYFELPLFVREGYFLPMGTQENTPEYDYAEGTQIHLYQPKQEMSCFVYNEREVPEIIITVKPVENRYEFSYISKSNGKIILHTDKKLGSFSSGCTCEMIEDGIQIIALESTFTVTLSE
jgi:Alpha-glucosidases, family 31 of glycosyl hydrolases